MLLFAIHHPYKMHTTCLRRAALAFAAFRNPAALRHTRTRTRTHARAQSALAGGAPPRMGVCFDIDGVLLRGNSVLPRARESLHALNAARVPFLFLTNGGGMCERERAERLAQLLGVEVHEEQVVLSHTPLRDTVRSYADRRVLVLGCRDVVGVARSYGARRIVTVRDLTHDDPYRYPFIHYEHKPLPEADRTEPFGAVFILHDPNDWGAEIQVALDVIRGGNPLGSGRAQATPVFASNPDLIFAGVYPVPRLACGAFTQCLSVMFKQVTGQELQVTQCGKPTKLTYDFARRQLGRWRALKYDTDPEEPLNDIFMIGDNPAADIQGANAAGHPWHSILVRTGVFHGSDGDNDRTFPAELCVAGVGEAVQHVLSHIPLFAPPQRVSHGVGVW